MKRRALVQRKFVRTFEDRLGELLADCHEEGSDALISAMELQIMALNEQEDEEGR